MVLLSIPHPGETIKEDYLVPLKMSVNELARALNMHAPRLNEIVRGERGIAAETALAWRGTSITAPSSGWSCSRTMICAREAHGGRSDQKTGEALFYGHLSHATRRG